MGILVRFFVGWSLVGLCIWFRYPVSGVSVDCANAEAIEQVALVKSKLYTHLVFNFVSIRRLAK